MVNELNVSEAVLLVGGKGERLKSVVHDRPKPMANVGGRPFVERILLLLQAQSVRRVVFCTAYMAAKIEDYFSDGKRWNMEFVYSRETSPLGTGGAVRRALSHLRLDRFFVLNGDSYCPADLRRLESEHLLRNARATLWCVRMEDCSRYGSVEINPDGAVRAFREKTSLNRPGIVNAGVYLLEREALEAIPDGSVVSLETDFFPSLIGHGLFAVVGDNSLLDIGTPEAFATAGKFFEQHVRS
jgi:NDP-sugar pyrophosphorylase family protein